MNGPRPAPFLLAAALLLLAALSALWRSTRSPEPVALTPSLTGETEYCLTCHTGLPEISHSHPVETFGCVRCHGGERLALEADLAHSTMRGGANPSDLKVVEQSCGGSECHSGEIAQERDHILRVQSSLQATYAGAIASIRYTFGAQPDPHARQGISAVSGLSAEGDRPAALEAFDPGTETSPAVLAFAQNCLNCHLWAEPLPGTEYARFTGCAACHTPTAGADLSPLDGENRPPIHRLTTAIPYTQCNTCHNRGNYDLRLIQFHPRQDRPADRLHDYYQPIAQFTRCEYVLDCVDCHTRQEAMGDGRLYDNQQHMQYVQCQTCHGTLTAPPRTRTITGPDDIALRMAFLNPVIDLQPGDTILVTERGEPLWNARQLEDGSFELVGKVTGVSYPLPLVQGSACEQNPDEQESRYCHACHAVER